MSAKPLELTLLSGPAKLETEAKRKRLVAVALSASVAFGGLFTALYLGKLGYDVRRTAMHDARLTGILRQAPTIYQVTEGLKEKAPLIEVLETDDQVARAAARWGKSRTPDIVSKASVSAETRVFSAGDMIYFIFFDGRSIMRDFELVSK